MTRRFVIGIDSLIPEQEDDFNRFLTQHGTWWHWISNMWLFVPKKGASETTDVNSIRAAVKKINPTARLLVMEIPEDITWAAKGAPNSQGGRIGDWLKREWVAFDE
jgi:hypothetical protein